MDQEIKILVVRLLKLETENVRLKLMIESYKAILLKLADSIEQYGDSGLIDNYTVSESDSPSLSDVWDEARIALAKGKK